MTDSLIDFDERIRALKNGDKLYVDGWLCTICTKDNGYRVAVNHGCVLGTLGCIAPERVIFLGKK